MRAREEPQNNRIRQTAASRLRVTRHPHAAPVARGSLRAKVLMKFPYSLIYFVDESEITLLADAQQKRRPFHWTSRV